MAPTFCIGATQHNLIASLHNEGLRRWKRKLLFGFDCVPPEAHATADMEVGATYM